MNNLKCSVRWFNDHKNYLCWLDTDYSTAYQELKAKSKEGPYRYFLVTAYNMKRDILVVISYEDNKLYEYYIYYNFETNKYEFVRGVEWKCDESTKFFLHNIYAPKKKMFYEERTSGYKCASVDEIVEHLKVDIFYDKKPTVEFLCN